MTWLEFHRRSIFTQRQIPSTVTITIQLPSCVIERLTAIIANRACTDDELPSGSYKRTIFLVTPSPARHAILRSSVWCKKHQNKKIKEKKKFGEIAAFLKIVLSLGQSGITVRFAGNCFSRRDSESGFVRGRALRPGERRASRPSTSPPPNIDRIKQKPHLPAAIIRDKRRTERKNKIK